MGKSLMDFNIKQSSSTDKNNIQWSLKNALNGELFKKRKTGKKNPNSSPTNIIYSQFTEKIEPKIKKIFKIENNEGDEKASNENPGKMHQKSSVTNSKIQKGYKRKAR